MVTQNLVGFWSFDQTTIKGQTVNDIWSKNHGTQGDAESVKGKFGQALSFDGKKDLVEIPHHASLDLKKEVTIEFWFLLKGQSGDNEYPRPVSKGHLWEITLVMVCGGKILGIQQTSDFGR